MSNIRCKIHYDIKYVFLNGNMGLGTLPAQFSFENNNVVSYTRQEHHRVVIRGNA